MLLAQPVLFVSMIAAALLRGMGDTVTPLKVLVVTCAASVSLTPAQFHGAHPETTSQGMKFLKIASFQ